MADPTQPPREAGFPISPATSEAQLREVSFREAESRAKAAREYVKTRTYIEKLQNRLRERDQDCDELHRRLYQKTVDHDALAADLATYTQLLAVAEDQARSTKEKLKLIQSSPSWNLTAPLRWLTPKSKRPSPATAPAAAPSQEHSLVYYFHTPPFRLYRADRAILRGWCYPENGLPITSLRAAIDARQFSGKIGLEEAEVIRVRGTPPGNPKPGFEVEIEITPGRHTLSVDAQIEGGPWQCFFRAPVWRI